MHEHGKRCGFRWREAPRVDEDVDGLVWRTCVLERGHLMTGHEPDPDATAVPAETTSRKVASASTRH
jgi:hypothetical protein